MGPFELVKDDHGYAMGIAIDGWFLIHLVPGTMRNEENAEKLLAILNAAALVDKNHDEYATLERALQDIQAHPETRKTQLRWKPDLTL